MEEAQLELKDNSGNTALCLAAINGNLEVVKIMVAKHKALLSMPDWEGMMPLCKAALSGRYDVMKYLFDKSDGLRGDGWDARNRAWLLQKCVEGDMFDIALQILTEHIELANDEELLRILARKPDAFVKKSSNFLWKTVIWVFAFVCPKEGHPKKDTEALQLLKMIIKDMINRDDRLSNRNQEQQPHPPELIVDYAKIEPPISSDIVFIAAEMGNTKFIVELIRQYPHLIRNVNHNNQTIFHVAVEHRHEGMYNLLYERSSYEDLIKQDVNGNNVLHLVAKSAKRKRLQDVSGVAFQMQRDLLWFRYVLGNLPTYFMSLYHMPVSIRSKLESLRSNFFLGSDLGERKMAWVSWKTCLASKEMGGLGIGSIHALNVGLFQSPWRGILSMVKSIKLKGVDLLSLCRRKLGNGETVSFWDDCWCGDQSLKSGIEASQFKDLRLLIEPVVLNSHQDTWTWSFGVLKGYTVASVHSLIDLHFLGANLNATRWNRSIPIKVNVFMSRAMFNKLPTRVNLDRKSIEVDSLLCPICHEDVETANQIFFTCDLAKVLWDLLAKWWELDVPFCASISDWLSWLDSLSISSKARVFLDGVGAALMWSLWSFRNRLLFSTPPPKKSLIWDSIVSYSFLWISSRNPKTKFSWVALLVAASARRTPRGAQFVNKLVVEMEEAQLELKDNSGNTSLCLAAINGNLEVVEIMVTKHKALLSMPDWEGMMPLCKAALSGRYDVVKYLFDKSDGLRGDGWDAKNRAWLLQKCVGGDMFDIALQILTEHIELANDEELLRILARKPDAFDKKSSNFLWKTVIWGKHFS
ncbi:RNA-directed DNA polymerase, eukaryota, reverse transcriptase zinc-binding domain protein [Tanacetum coccineum]